MRLIMLKNIPGQKQCLLKKLLAKGAVLNEAQTHMDQEHQNQLVENLLGELNPDQRACVVLARYSRVKL